MKEELNKIKVAAYVKAENMTESTTAKIQTMLNTISDTANDAKIAKRLDTQLSTEYKMNNNLQKGIGQKQASNRENKPKSKGN